MEMLMKITATASAERLNQHWTRRRRRIQGPWVPCRSGPCWNFAKMFSRFSRFV